MPSRKGIFYKMFLVMTVALAATFVDAENEDPGRLPKEYFEEINAAEEFIKKSREDLIRLQKEPHSDFQIDAIYQRKKRKRATKIEECRANIDFRINRTIEILKGMGDPPNAVTEQAVERARTYLIEVKNSGAARIELAEMDESPREGEIFVQTEAKPVEKPSPKKIEQVDISEKEPEELTEETPPTEIETQQVEIIEIEAELPSEEAQPTRDATIPTQPVRDSGGTLGSTIVWISPGKDADAELERDLSILPSLRRGSDLQFTLEDLEGTILILHYWAAWCGPCRPELPKFMEYLESDRFAEMKRRYDVGPYLVTIDPFWSDGDSFLRKLNLPSSNLYHDPHGELRELWTRGAAPVDDGSIPATIVLAKGPAGPTVLGRLPQSDWESMKPHEEILGIIQNGTDIVRSEERQ